MNELREPLIMSQTVDITEMMNSEFQRLKPDENTNEYIPVATPSYQSIEDTTAPVHGIRTMTTEASFLRRRDKEKNSIVLVFEMDSKEGFQPIRAISLRALLYEVLHEVEPGKMSNFKRCVIITVQYDCSCQILF